MARPPILIFRQLLYQIARFATAMGMPIVGCAHHRFNLAISGLARFTKYKPLQANATRWSSTYQMLRVGAAEDVPQRPGTHRRFVQLVAKL
ncbi:hypothetical protein PHMEG_00018578 [Phytophthora megakarya]|uniref:Uncharacterized protein n=1 Tax=Phytophthora megakarya TaxID=4795 RepID=A0A225VTR9_9STRA|nr:hypothetical protein PHMEG_00018578 [Phytophthora megakarya]